MIVIADSGSTKTEWRLCSREKIHAETRTSGLNPLALSKDSVVSELEDSELFNWPVNKVSEVYFYGAGIVDEVQRNLVSGILYSIFSNAEIEVSSDMLGAARAVFGNEQGIIGILGTGSNTALYDGHEISRQIPALGFILGDEGSGAVMGKNLIKHFLRNELSNEVSSAFREYYPDYNNLLQNIYSERHASRFLASFVPFLYENKADQFIRQVILSELNKFIKLIRSYPGSHKIGIVGSVGFQFQSELNLLASNAELNIVAYLKNPIENLVVFHQNNMA